MSRTSCIYSGWVMHRRLKPRRHRFRYRAWWLLIDLDEIPRLTGELRWFSHGRFNLFAFHDGDHGHGQGPLRPQIERRLGEAGIDVNGGAIRLLCMPRTFGYAFNPLSVYFCYRPDSMIAATVYEVHNTFGERHSYVIEAAPGSDGVMRQKSCKRFYVSPFMDMEMVYEFRVSQPGDAITIGISGSDGSGPVIHAALQARRRALTDAELVRLFFSHTLITLKVIGAIHWEALMLWRKRLQLRARPHAPAPPVTIVSSHQRAKSSHA